MLPPVALIGLFAVILLLAAEAADVPLDPVAITVNVYDVPVVNPVTVIGDDAPDAVIFPGDDVTVYDVTVTFVGAVKDTVASKLVPAVADTDVGASGTGET
jgi:hypothetical protein